MAKEKLEWVETTISEKSNILPETQLKFNEDGTVTIPEVTLWNPSEALKYIRELENSTILKLRESNEYIINEVKEMLETAFQWWYHSDNNRPKERRGGEKSAVCSDHDYDFDKKYYLDSPIKFLSEYKWNLQKFMDLLAQEIKWREFWCWNDLYIMCERFWISIEELKNMDSMSLIELIKEDIKNIPLLNNTTCCNNTWEHLWAARFYLNSIKSVCEKFWYKFK